MKLIDVIDGGMFTTVQDLGRYGYQRYGVPVSGALDTLALRAANLLVGNEDGAAGLEMTLMGPQLRFRAAATIAVTGADLGAAVNGVEIQPWSRVQVAPGAVLTFPGARSGVRGYFAVAGGIDVPLTLGSRSTYTRSRLGGLDGRPLQAGDTLSIPGPFPMEDFTPRAVPASRQPVFGGTVRLRVIPGPQADRFSEEGMRTFLESEYRVTPQSDRMGYRLSGPKIEHVSGPDIVSDGTPPGAVQVAGDGMPIVLLADRGTAGGYTKIATVIGADLRLLAQAAPGDLVRFEATTLEAAHEALREEERWLDDLRRGTGADHRRKVAAAVAVVRWLSGSTVE